MKRTVKHQDKLRQRVAAPIVKEEKVEMTQSCPQSEPLPSVVTLDEDWAHEEAKSAYLITMVDQLLSNIALRHSLSSKLKDQRTLPQ